MSADAPRAPVAIARVVGVFGLRGELKLAASDPDAVRVGLTVAVHREDVSVLTAAIAAVRKHKNNLVAKLAGIDDASAAAALHGAELRIAYDELPRLPPETYREVELVGMIVVDETLGELGAVQEVRHYPACDMLVVGAKPTLVPLLLALWRARRPSSTPDFDPAARGLRGAHVIPRRNSPMAALVSAGFSAIAR